VVEAEIIEGSAEPSHFDYTALHLSLRKAERGYLLIESHRLKIHRSKRASRFPLTASPRHGPQCVRSTASSASKTELSKTPSHRTPCISTICPSARRLILSAER